MVLIARVIILYANIFDFDISFDSIQITIVRISISHCYPFRWYSVLLYCTYSNKLLDSDKRESECQNVLGEEGGGRRARCAKKRERKRMEGAGESDVVGRTKENGICTGSQPNPTSSKCRKDGSRRVKATWSECHPLRNRPCEIRLGWRGAPWLPWYFSTLQYVEREVARQMRDKCGSHRSSSRNVWYLDHHNSGSAVLSLIPIKLTNDCGWFEGEHSPAVNHEDKSGYQQTS